MAWCPMCGNFWLIRTGQKVKRAIMGRSHTGVQEIPDIICSACEKVVE